MPENSANKHIRGLYRIKWMRKGAYAMSAIAGIFDLPTDENVENAMFLTMKRRGPDGSAVYSWKGKILLHSRLSHTNYAQPMVLDWAAERYVMSCDGTLFNREEIHRELKKLGHEFDSGSDAEVILHSFAQWGEEMLIRLNGVFALMIVMERQEKVFLARDRMGVKPLFYKTHNGGLLASSELKSILSYPGVEAKLDAAGAAQILLLGPGRIPGSGVFYGVKELEPGCCGVYQRGNLQLRRYWQLTDRIHEDDFEKTTEKVRDLVKDAIIRQMKAPQKVGTMLSGGLDSSVVSAICARELDANGQCLDTFSVDYEDNDKYFISNRFQPNMDTDFIRIMQESLDSHHHWTVLSARDLVDGIADATIARDLPGMADVDVSLLAFCKQIRPHVNTVLSGECADEIFGGYPWYRDPQMRDVDTFPWAQTTKERTAFLAPWILQQIQPEEFVYDQYRDTVRASDILPENSPVDRRIKELVNLNFRWFMQTLIDRGDRMGAYCGLDIRMPFCDYRIAEYLYGVPWSMKDFKGQEKGLLRHGMEGLLPQSVLYRKKSPFPKTYDPRYLQIVSQLLQQVIADKNAPIFQLVRKEALENLLHQDFAWPWYGQLMRRPQTIVYMLQINFWLEHYSLRII